MKVILKKVNEDIQIVETDKQYVNEACKEVLGEDCRYERVGIDRNLNMYCFEDFIDRGLDMNFAMMTSNPYLPLQFIAGDVVFIRIKPVNIFEEIWDYEVDDITEDDIELIKEVIMKI